MIAAAARMVSGTSSWSSGIGSSGRVLVIKMVTLRRYRFSRDSDRFEERYQRLVVEADEVYVFQV